MSNTKLTKRVMTLIENKSKDFKEKFYLLSYLANTDIKSDEKLMSEADCYINTLVNTDGVKPDIKHVHNLLKESIKIKEGTKYKKEFECVKDLCHLINIEKLSSEESFIFEELNSISSLTDFKLNNKLKNIFLKSVNNNTPLLISEAIKTVDADDPSSGRRSIIDLDAEADEFENEEDAYLEKDDEWSEEKLTGKQVSLSAKQKDILKQYSWLFKPENIPYIGKITNIYLTADSKKGSKKVDTTKNLSNIPDIDKLAVIAKYRLVVEDKATNVAMRKYEIIKQTYYYLNIQKRFMDSDMAAIIAMGEKDQSGLKKSSLRGSSPSGLNEEQKTQIKEELNKLILKINTSDISTLDSNVITEAELLTLLKKASGSQRENIEAFMSYLNSAYPLTGNHRTDTEFEKDIPNRMSDEEYEEYLRGNRELEEKEAQEDQEFYDGQIDTKIYDKEGNWISGTGEPLYANVETASKIASSYVTEDDFEEIEVEAHDAIQLMAKKSSSLKKIISLEADAKEKQKLVASSKEEKQKFIEEFSSSMTRAQADAEKQKPNWKIRMFLSNDQRQEFDRAIEEYSVLAGTKLNVIPNKTKKQAFREIVKTLESPVGANRLNPKTGKVETATWDNFFEKYINYDPDSDEKVTNADIARLSQNQWTGSGGVRQSTNKSFLKSLFYTSNIKVKSEIYSELGKIYIDTARRLGLMELDTSSVEIKKDNLGNEVLGNDGKKIEVVEIIEKGDAVGFRKMEELITNADVFEEYFTRGMTDEDEEDALNYLTMDHSSFDIFCNKYFDYFYSNRIWNKCEVEIALAIKKYFELKYPASKIGQGLSDSIKSWRADKIQKQFGKDIFNPIINWTMGRSGIKDSGNVVSNPVMELDQRKSSFLNGQGHFKSIAERVNSFNNMSQTNKIIDFDPEHLMYDCLNDTSKVSSPFPIIGPAYENANKLSADDRSMFLKFISKKNNTEFEKAFIESLLKQEYFDASFKNPNSPLGNPAEISGIEKGEASDSPADKGQPLSVKGTPYFREHWRKAIKSSLKDLAVRADREAKEREIKLSQSRNYDFLEDEELILTDYQVIYNGKLAEISTIDMENQKAKVIIDVLDTKGNVIDVKTVTADFSELRHADLMRK